jgi:hypothetical protein
MASLRSVRIIASITLLRGAVFAYLGVFGGGVRRSPFAAAGKGTAT